jgi:hypothetical protein
MATKRQRRKRRRRHAGGEGRSTGSAGPVASATASSESGAGGAVRRGSETLPARRGPDDRPAALWGDFPLSEIVVFIGILLLIAGFFVSPPQGFVMIAVGLVLGSLAGLELSIREHFAGYRSHTLLLAAAIGVPLFGVLFILTTVPTPVCIAAGLLAFGGSAWLFAQAFRRRSGGALLRLRG